MGRYAERTEVSPERSVAEVERTLGRFGATKFATMRDAEKGLVAIAFSVGAQTYRLGFPIPGLGEFEYTPTRQKRAAATQTQLRDQEYRRRWRSLANYLKAILDARESGIIDTREALMPYAVLPSGQTVAEHLGPQMQRALEAGQMPSIDRALGSGEPR